jgi:hypothetical protein
VIVRVEEDSRVREFPRVRWATVHQHLAVARRESHQIDAARIDDFQLVREFARAACRLRAERIAGRPNSERGSEDFSSIH